MQRDENRAIGVFDSGLGGISVLKELRNQMKNEDFLYYGDSRYAPYGEKSKDEIMKRCKSICDFFIQKGVKAIVIACNTATSACVKELREHYSHIPIIGMEPALKIAAEKDGEQHVLVLATSFTLKEKKFADLVARYEVDNVIYKQSCPKLVELVEQHQLDQKELVLEVLCEYLRPFDLSKLHSIVLGCTHFVFFKEYLYQCLPKHIEVIDGNLGTANHLAHILTMRDDRSTCEHIGHVSIYNSRKENTDVINVSNELMNR